MGLKSLLLSFLLLISLSMPTSAAQITGTPNDKALEDAIKARNYGDLTMPTLGDTTGVLGYASGDLSKTDALDLLQNNEFLQDLYDFFFERDGITFSSPQEAVQEFYSDRGWKTMNVTSMAKEGIYTTIGGASNTQKARLARLEKVYNALPNYYEPGGSGQLVTNLGKLAFDAVSLIGFGVGALVAKGVFITARVAVKSILGDVVKKGTKKAALIAALISGGVHGGYNASEQARDIAIGVQDEFSKTNIAASVSIGAAAGGLLGGIFGAGGVILLRSYSARSKSKLKKRQWY